MNAARLFPFLNELRHYSLRDFRMPNFLMLGVGYRYNNKYPRHR